MMDTMRKELDQTMEQIKKHDVQFCTLSSFHALEDQVKTMQD